MRPLLTIASLTLRGAVRYRLFTVLGLLLALTVVVLPLLLKHDDTAHGFTQITLTYTLGLTTVLLGFVTLWLGCGVLAREMEECQLQMVDVKPVARWQVWLGKWLGIMTLNIVLLTIAAGCVYGTLLYRGRQLPTVPVDQRAALFNQVLVARQGIREAPTDLDTEVAKLVAAAKQRGLPEGVDEKGLRSRLRADQQAAYESVPPNNLRRWLIDFKAAGARPRGDTLHLRVKFFAAESSPTEDYPVEWTIGPLNGVRHKLSFRPLAGETFHELPVPAAWIGADGTLAIDAANRSATTLVFPLADGMEVLYREAGFTLNLLRALGVILCWLGLLTAVGLAAGSGLSFPVAAFVALTLLVVALSSGTLAGVVEQGAITEADHETGEFKRSWVDVVILPVFKGVLAVVNFASGFAPIDALSTGRSVSWTEVGLAVLKVIIVLGGLCAATGIWIFTRREIARVQVNT